MVCIGLATIQQTHSTRRIIVTQEGISMLQGKLSLLHISPTQNPRITINPINFYSNLLRQCHICSTMMVFRALVSIVLWMSTKTCRMIKLPRLSHLFSRKCFSWSFLKIPTTLFSVVLWKINARFLKVTPIITSILKFSKQVAINMSPSSSI